MKKFISGILAIGITLSSVLSFTSSSAFDPTKDPNGDGHLTIADSTAILQYLGGVYEPSDLSQLDVDNNSVVSVVDSEYIVMHDAGMLNSSIEQPVEPASNTLIRRSYVAYNSKTGALLRNYALSVVDSINTTNTNSRSIIGNDNRVVDWSNEGVVKIMSNDFYLGTGFVVDSHTIATAAHCVYFVEEDRIKSISEIYLFNKNSNTPISITPVETHVPSSYVNASSYNDYYDYALVTVEEDLSDYMSFNLGAITSNAALNNIPIVTVGFPTTINGNSNNHSAHYKVLSNGVITPPDNGDNIDSNYLFCHTADTLGGNSGSPIYATETLNGITYNTVVGMNITGGQNYNYAIRFNSHILKFLTNNRYIQY